MGAVLLVEAVEVGGVLEVVGVNLAALGDEVGLDVVAELNNLEVDALLGQNLLGHVQDLGMGRGGGSDLQGRTGQFAGLGGGLGSLGGSCGALGGGSLRGCGDGISRSGGAASGQRQGQRSGERCRNQFFHGKFSFIYLYISSLYIVRCVGFERSASLKASHSHTGLLVNGTSFHSHKLPFQTKAGCRLSGIPLQVFITRCNLRTRKLAQDAYASCTCTSSYQSRLHSWFCTPFLNLWSALFAFHGSQYTPVSRFCQHLFA